MIYNFKYYYERNLPHYQPLDAIYHITFRLYDSIPKNILNDFQNSFNKSEIEEHLINPKEKKLNQQTKYFKKFDSYLAKQSNGPFWLQVDKIAGTVSESIIYRNDKEYDLICFCIMPNHVHLIIENPRIQLFTIMKYLKGYTSFRCNKILCRKGPFWQPESYDHIIRDRNELENQIIYVLENPVKAGLVNNWNDWKWSYCKDEMNPLL